MRERMPVTEETLTKIQNRSKEMVSGLTQFRPTPELALSVVVSSARKVLRNKRIRIDRYQEETLTAAVWVELTSQFNKEKIGT